VRCRNCHAVATLERAGDKWRSRAMRERAMQDALAQAAAEA